MKGILIILDGLADLPCKKLKGKTPLEAAETPNLDYLSSKGDFGYLYPVKKGFVPGTSEAIISIFGREWQEYPRGWLEALGAGLELKKGDLALRANFATIDNMENREIIDRRAGRNLTTKEAEKLAKTLNEKIKIFHPFIFKPTLQHRAVLVIKGGFSDRITPTDPEYLKVKDRKFRFSVPENDDELSEYSANLLNNFTKQAFELLKEHPVNIERRKKGFLPANIILCRAAGTYIKKIKKYRNWCCSTSVPVIKGICKVLGINLHEFSPIKSKNYDAYSNLKKNLMWEIKKTIKMLKKSKEDYAFVYLKETDAAGHDNKPLEKKEMLEIIDKKLFSFLKKFGEKNKIKIIITSDHSTPCELKKHSADPVPVLFCNWKKKKEPVKFCERNARKGKLGKLESKTLLDLFKKPIEK